MMTKREVVDLLSLIAVYDQRTVGQADIEGWHLIARNQAWTAPLAQRAVIEHHSADASRGRITPAHISDRIREARDRVRKAALHRDLTPPRHLADQPAAEIAWRRTEAQRLVDGGLRRWAATGELPTIAQPKAEPVRSIPDRVRALIGGRFAIPGKTDRQQAADASERAARRDAARRELATRGPSPIPTEETR